MLITHLTISVQVYRIGHTSITIYTRVPELGITFFQALGILDRERQN